MIKDGVYYGASESRKDGHAAGYWIMSYTTYLIGNLIFIGLLYYIVKNKNK
jgi:hypothetical protein